MKFPWRLNLDVVLFGDQTIESKVRSMSSTEETFRIEKLTADNYANWKFQMQMLLIGKNLWEIVEGTETLPTEANQQQRQDFRKRSNKALSLICLSVSTNLNFYVRSAKTGKEAWESLQNHFEEKTLARKVSLHTKLFAVKFDGSVTMAEHVNNIRTIADQLAALDKEIDESFLVMILLGSLPKDYYHLLTALETLPEEKLTWVYVRDRVITEFERKTTVEEQRSPHNALLAGGGAGGKRGGGAGHGGAGNNANFRGNGPKCHFCHEFGHIQRNCQKKQAQAIANANANTNVKDEKQDDASASFCLSDKTKQLSLSGFCPEFALHVQADFPRDDVAKYDRKFVDNKWLLDSACSHHMTGEKGDLVNFKKFDDGKACSVQLADESLVRAVGSGDLNVYLPDSVGNSVPVVFKDVMYVPKLGKRLISIGQLTKRGAQVTFNSDSVHMRLGGKNFFFGCSHGNLYNMNCGVVASCNFVAIQSEFNEPLIDETSEVCSVPVGELMSEVNSDSGSSVFKGVIDDSKLNSESLCIDIAKVDDQNPNDIVSDKYNISFDGGVEVGILASGVPACAGGVGVGKDSTVGDEIAGDVSSWSDEADSSETRSNEAICSSVKSVPTSGSYQPKLSSYRNDSDLCRSNNAAMCVPGTEIFDDARPMPFNADLLGVISMRSDVLMPLWTTKFCNVLDCVCILSGVDVLCVARVIASVSGPLSVGRNQFCAQDQNFQDCCVLQDTVVDNRQLISSGSVGNYAINCYCQFPGLYNRTLLRSKLSPQSDITPIHLAHGFLASFQSSG